ncbi:MAG: HD domain-containing protein [Bacteroidota bacterium]|nr:HD domain-containing protein [Bacteroidota bacterium]
MGYRKIINDPVYGFITIDDELIYEVISHRYYQRLRRIYQMAMAQLVYPGAVHTRLHHSLGAYHLMGSALTELQGKGVEISPAEQQAAKLAILLHDIGHGPYSHALEKVLIEGVSHEEISLMIMEKMNREFSGQLGLAIAMFKNEYPRKFFHQLISGQLDVDRMDYLIRDSFFTGVSEGIIGYDRILKMLVVHQGQLMIEEKGIYSIEKFLVSRRLMYWQVYLHKTVLCAERMLVHIIRRARELGAQAPTGSLNTFLHSRFKSRDFGDLLEDFCTLDDYDVLTAIKSWTRHPDKILSFLCIGIIDRHLLKVRYFGKRISDKVLGDKTQRAMEDFHLSRQEAGYIVFSGEAVNKTYNSQGEHIRILFKDQSVKDITEVDNPLITQTLLTTAKKFYICFPEPK